MIHLIAMISLKEALMNQICIETKLGTLKAASGMNRAIPGLKFTWSVMALKSF